MDSSPEDLWNAVADLVLAQREERIKADQERIAAEGARIEAERRAERARIADERRQFESDRMSEWDRFEAERQAAQARFEAGKQAENTAANDGAGDDRNEPDTVKTPAKKRRGKKGSETPPPVESALFSGEAVSALAEAFRPFGYQFTLISRDRRMADHEHDIFGEVSLFLENSSCAIAAALSAALKRKHVDDHIECMKNIRRYADAYGDKRQFFGALAAAEIDEAAEQYALQQGFYIVKGPDCAITKPVSGAKSW